MVPVILLLFVIALSLLITRTAASALVLTGLSRDSARFQARSAYCGVGFTTNESESITRHPVRRRIIMMLMLLGNAGIATVVATVILSVANTGRAHWSQSLVVIGIGLLIIGAIANSSFIDHHMTRVIEWALRRFTRLDVRDYTALLQLARGFTIVEVKLKRAIGWPIAPWLRLSCRGRVFLCWALPKGMDPISEHLLAVPKSVLATC